MQVRHDETISGLIAWLPLGTLIGVSISSGFVWGLLACVIGWFLRNYWTTKHARRLGMNFDHPEWLDYMPAKLIRRIIWKSYIIGVVVSTSIHVLK